MISVNLDRRENKITLVGGEENIRQAKLVHFKFSKLETKKDHV